MTVFEPKYHFSDAIPPSHIHVTCVKIEGLECYLKDSPVPYVWTWHIFNPKIKQKNNFFIISGSSLHFLK